jgi:hypothetical protein
MENSAVALYQQFKHSLDFAINSAKERITKKKQI